jgi:hypothetical protein
LRSSDSDSSASDKSRSIQPADEFWSDTGPTSDGGERLLPTPDGGSFNDGQSTEAWRERKARELAKGYNRNGFGTPIAMAVQLLSEGIDPISSSEGHPASPSAKPGTARRRRTSDGFGLSSPASFATLDPDGFFLKTYRDSSIQATLLGPPLARFSGIWPKWGSLRDGTVYEHPRWVPPIDEDASSYLPTPKTPTGGSERRASRAARNSGGEDLRASIGELMDRPSSDGRE